VGAGAPAPARPSASSVSSRRRCGPRADRRRRGRPHRRHDDAHRARATPAGRCQADGFETACYALVLLAAVVRVVLPLLAPALTLPAILGSAALWSAGFGLYAIRYWPVLTRPRVDGMPG
jgi:hypothetical protein